MDPEKATTYVGPYGDAHRRPPTMHRTTRRKSRRRAHELARRVVTRHNRGSNTPPWWHPGCETDHRKRSAAVRCCRRAIWRIAGDPDFLADRVTITEYLQAKGWL